MSNLLIGAVSALLATNQPAALSNLVEQQTGIVVSASGTNDAAGLELEKLMEADDAAQEEVDKWILENAAFAEKGAGISREELNAKIRKRFGEVRAGYEDFLKRHTNYSDGYVAYASFLGDTGDEDRALELLEKARAINPKDPAVWNNLANIYGHGGPVTNAFVCYTKAIELNPDEPVYYHNFGTTVFLFRKDAMEHYGISEQQVFDKALGLYAQAMKHAPDDFLLATDVARTYYGIKPPRTDAALQSWTNAFKLARDDIEREGVQLHFVRVKTHSGRFAEAYAHLATITNAMYAELKGRLERTLKDKELEAGITNSAAPDVSKPVEKTEKAGGGK